MISVPLAGTFPRTPRPVWFMNGSITSSGNPCGYVGIASGVRIPISSQCPVVVSLPRDRSSSLPATAGAPGWGGHPSSGSTLPSPRASSVGRSSPPTALPTFPSVSEPSSPKSTASGSSPAPTASSTITHALGTRLSYGLVANVLGLIGFAIFIACTIALAAGITWLVVRVSPNPESKKN